MARLPDFGVADIASTPPNTSAVRGDIADQIRHIGRIDPGLLDTVEGNLQLQRIFGVFILEQLSSLHDLQVTDLTRRLLELNPDDNPLAYDMLAVASQIEGEFDAEILTGDSVERAIELTKDGDPKLLAHQNAKDKELEECRLSDLGLLATAIGAVASLLSIIHARGNGVAVEPSHIQNTIDNARDYTDHAVDRLGTDTSRALRDYVGALLRSGQI